MKLDKSIVLMNRNNRCPKTGKVIYDSERLAISHSKRLRKRVGPKTKPYQCLFFEHWHIGHNRPPHRRKQLAP